MISSECVIINARTTALSTGEFRVLGEENWHSSFLQVQFKKFGELELWMNSIPKRMPRISIGLCEKLAFMLHKMTKIYLKHSIKASAFEGRSSPDLLCLFSYAILATALPFPFYS